MKFFRNSKVAQYKFKYLTNISVGAFSSLILTNIFYCNRKNDHVGVIAYIIIRCIWGHHLEAEFLVIKVVDSGLSWGKERPPVVLRIANESVNRNYDTIR